MHKRALATALAQNSQPALLLSLVCTDQLQPSQGSPGL